MPNYVVITTPSCSRCKILQRMVEDQSIKVPVEFVDFRDDLAKGLMENYEMLSAGIVFDRETGTEVEIKDLVRMR